MITVFIVAGIIAANHIYRKSIIEVEVHTVDETTIISSVTSSGKVEEINKSEIYVELPLRVKDIMVKEGDMVKAGQVLFDVDTQSLELQLAQARLSTYMGTSAIEAWNEGNPEFNDKEQAMDYYNTKNNTVELQIRDLENKLRNQPKKITSPIDGIITKLNVKKGMIADSTQAAAVVSDVSSLRVKANIGEYFISKIKEGQKVKITGDAFEGESYHGVVKEISPIAKQVNNGHNSETIVEVYIDVIEKETKLKPGYSAEVKIETGRKENVITVPYECVTQENGNIDICYIVRNGRAQKVPVTVGHELELEIEITNGLKKGDKVILNPTDKIKEGTLVKVKKES